MHHVLQNQPRQPQQRSCQRNHAACVLTWCLSPMHSRALQGLDSFLAMSSMFGYTGTLVLILSLGSLSYYTACWPLFIFVAGACWGCSGRVDVGPAQQQQQRWQLHQVAQGLPLPCSNSRQQAADSRFLHGKTPCVLTLSVVPACACCADMRVPCSADAVGVCAGQAAAVAGLPAQHVGVQLAALLPVQLCNGGEAGPGGAVHLCRWGRWSARGTAVHGSSGAWGVGGSGCRAQRSAAVESQQRAGFVFVCSSNC